MAVLALRKKIRFQIQCCDQIIPTKQVVATLSTRSKRLYSARVDEEAVPAAERWYCAQAGCRQWIPSKYLKPGSKSQRCPHCRTASCSQCRDLAHADHPCFEDPGLADVLEIARRRHWQRCPSCHAMVERTGGCPHMRCRCGVDFW